MSVTNHDDDDAVDDVRDLSPEYVECRFERRHRLNRMPDPQYDQNNPTPRGWYQFHYYCDRCGMKRHTLRARGVTPKHKYDPPPRYKLVGEDLNLKLFDYYLELDQHGQIRTKKPPRAPRRLVAVG